MLKLIEGEVDFDNPKNERLDTILRRSKKIIKIKEFTKYTIKKILDPIEPLKFFHGDNVSEESVPNLEEYLKRQNLLGKINEYKNLKMIYKFRSIYDTGDKIKIKYEIKKLASENLINLEILDKEFKLEEYFIDPDIIKLLIESDKILSKCLTDGIIHRIIAKLIKKYNKGHGASIQKIHITILKKNN